MNASTIANEEGGGRRRCSPASEQGAADPRRRRHAEEIAAPWSGPPSDRRDRQGLRVIAATVRHRHQHPEALLTLIEASGPLAAHRGARRVPRRRACRRPAAAVPLRRRLRDLYDQVFQRVVSPRAHQAADDDGLRERQDPDREYFTLREHFKRRTSSLRMRRSSLALRQRDHPRGMTAGTMPALPRPARRRLPLPQSFSASTASSSSVTRPGGAEDRRGASRHSRHRRAGAQVGLRPHNQAVRVRSLLAPRGAGQRRAHRLVIDEPLVSGAMRPPAEARRVRAVSRDHPCAPVSPSRRADPRPARPPRPSSRSLAAVEQAVARLTARHGAAQRRASAGRREGGAALGPEAAPPRSSRLRPRRASSPTRRSSTPPRAPRAGPEQTLGHLHECGGDHDAARLDPGRFGGSTSCSPTSISAPRRRGPYRTKVAFLGCSLPGAHARGAAAEGRRGTARAGPVADDGPLLRRVRPRAPGGRRPPPATTATSPTTTFPRPSGHARRGGLFPEGPARHLPLGAARRASLALRPALRRGLARQRAILAVMERICAAGDPRAVIDNADRLWAVRTPCGRSTRPRRSIPRLARERERTRYERLLAVFTPPASRTPTAGHPN